MSIRCGLAGSLLA